MLLSFHKKISSSFAGSLVCSIQTLECVTIVCLCLPSSDDVRKSIASMMMSLLSKASPNPACCKMTSNFSSTNSKQQYVIWPGNGLLLYLTRRFMSASSPLHFAFFWSVLFWKDKPNWTPQNWFWANGTCVLKSHFCQLKRFGSRESRKECV